MKLFNCQNCGQILHFENRLCLNCNARVGYAPDQSELVVIGPIDDTAVTSAPSYKLCQNAEFDACNWLIPAEDADNFCVACRHNREIPDLSLEVNRQRWVLNEQAKHHLFYTLLRCRLAIPTRAESPEAGLEFQFLADTEVAGKTVHVLTGHENGLITLNIAEADDTIREQRRVSMGEPYRTLLGHFRHEIGHYYWDRLVAGQDSLGGFRAIFGDETIDYNESLKVYYDEGPRPQWQEQFVSAYATAHPWEDFAETWTHYFHIIDTLEMANAYGLHVHVASADSTDSDLTVAAVDPYGDHTIEKLIDTWRPIALALNSLNRCMGQSDLYPFVLTEPVIEKLGFVHDLIWCRAASDHQAIEVAA